MQEYLDFLGVVGPRAPRKIALSANRNNAFDQDDMVIVEQFAYRAAYVH